ncbi:MAG: hypothetical protein DWH94_06545 [Planctomycetota bacterium]|nr:MAG: hypothetical protein DWH80_12445 [Planctomycetota bacterium]RLS57732.1 MAG: hypothetical protein DWH94_06545 [Planctomycetota bacterium]RLS99084.1 MAG: hypothetical protein DWI13_01890 [Planctomycetota bacterium]TSA08763.1 MAG: hypothetical protein D4R77_02250 [Planctomycetaceae bacterium]
MNEIPVEREPIETDLLKRSETQAGNLTRSFQEPNSLRRTPSGLDSVALVRKRPCFTMPHWFDRGRN